MKSRRCSGQSLTTAHMTPEPGGDSPISTDKTAALYRRQFAVLQAIILIAVLLSVANSVTMSIFERTGSRDIDGIGNRGRMSPAGDHGKPAPLV